MEQYGETYSVQLGALPVVWLFIWRGNRRDEGTFIQVLCGISNKNICIFDFTSARWIVIITKYKWIKICILFRNTYDWLKIMYKL